MTAVVMVEAGAIALLGVLVFGLLRTQRRIVNLLRNATPLPQGSAAAGNPSTGPPPGGEEHPGLALGVVAPELRGREGGGRALGEVAPELRGEDLNGRAVSWEPKGPSVLAFLTSGCVTCAWWWGQLGRPGRFAVPDLVVITPDPGTDSPADIGPLAGQDLRVIMSSDGWSAYGVRAGSTFVVVDGGRVRASGVASDWNGLMALVASSLRG